MNTFIDLKSILQNKQKTARVAVIFLLILAALFLFLFRTGSQEEKELSQSIDSEDISSVKTDITEDFIVVDVAGEVKSPSVIELPIDSRINDAIVAAGGLTKDADISQINRAAPLSDGEKIYIPKKADQSIEEETDMTGSEEESTSVQNESTGNIKININLAKSEKLQEIPGVGPVTAEKIIAYRTEHGLFRKLEDLMKVSGIGEKTFEKMQPYICI
jgi:competence protein ComEA